MAKNGDRLWVIHHVETPDIYYLTRIYLDDGYHEHLVGGHWIDGHIHDMDRYETLIDHYMVSNNLYNSDDYYRDMVITIDDNDSVTVFIK